MLDSVGRLYYDLRYVHLKRGGKSMSKKNEKKMDLSKTDLLDLPVAERKRLCSEIRAALRERVAVRKIPIADDSVISNKNMSDFPCLKPIDKAEKDPDAILRKSLINSLTKRIW